MGSWSPNGRGVWGEGGSGLCVGGCGFRKAHLQRDWRWLQHPRCFTNVVSKGGGVEEGGSGLCGRQ